MSFKVETFTAPPPTPISAHECSSACPLDLPEWVAAKLGHAREVKDHPLVLYQTQPEAEERVLKAKLIYGPSSMSNELDSANRFLVARIEGLGPYKRASFSTVEKLACNLRYFLDWLEKVWYAESADRHYLDFGEADRRLRPTYAYREYLIRSPELSPSTKNARITAVRMLYEDLERRGVLRDADRSRYQQRSARKVRSYSSTGRILETPISSSDLSIPHTSRGANPCLRDSVIDDGIVRPLDDPELAVVTKALRDTDNPSVRLGSCLALNTGARLQTVLTLRRRHAHQLRDAIAQGLQYLAIPVGGSSLAQTKRGIPYWLVVPVHANRMLVDIPNTLGEFTSVAELLANYESSDTAEDRYQKAKAIRQKNKINLEEDLDEYLFLGRNGLPFYLHHKDPLNLLRKSPRMGQGFKRSISNAFAHRVSKIAERDGVATLTAVKVGFHDFRGTFAERSLIAGVEVGLARGLDRVRAEAAALRATQRLLGHRRIESTERYLRFRECKQALLSANESYGRSLLKDVSEW